MIGFTINDRATPVLDWKLDAETDQGDRSATGKLPGDVTWAEQDAPIVAWRGADDPLWSGQIELDPHKEDDLWTFRAVGNADVYLAPQRAPMLFRHDGGDGWVAEDSDPHNYTTSPNYNVDPRPGRLVFFHEQEAYLLNDRAGIVFWAEGSTITRYSYVLNKSSDVSAFQFLIRRAFGPDGGFTTPADAHATTALSGAGPASGERVTIDMDDEADQICHFINCTSGTTPAVRRRFWASGLRVYGRTTDDDFSISDAVTDVGTNAGLATDGVQPNVTGVLPLYWEANTSHLDLLDYLAELADWRWLVTHRGLEFGPFAKTWDVFSGDGEINLTPERRYNRARVAYRALSGALRTSTAEPSVDPFPGREVFPEEDIELEDPQPDDVVANAVAQAHVEHLSALNMTGTATIHVARFNGPRSPYEVAPGDLVRFPELHPIGPQRITGVTYEPDDRVTLEVGNFFNLAREMAEAAKLPHVRRKRRRRKKGRGLLPPVPR